MDDRKRADRARQAAAQAIAAARQRGDRRAEADALLELSRQLRRAHRDEEAAHVEEQAGRIYGGRSHVDDRERAEKAGQAAAQAIAAAHERGDWRSEVSSLLELSRQLRSRELRNAARDGEAAYAEEQAMRISREHRARERVESSTQAVSIAQSHGDRAAEALALLTLGQALMILGRPVEAESAFEQAERLTYDVIAAAKLAAADTRRAELLTGLSALIALGKAFGDAGRDDIARHVTVQATLLDPANSDTAVRSVGGNRGLPAVTNHVSDVVAGSVIQVGVLHGDLTVHNAPRRPVETLYVSVTTERGPVKYSYGGGTWHPDTSVKVFVEAFTAQAVILRQLRPVFVRRISQARRIDPPPPPAAYAAEPRKFEVTLDPPHLSRPTRYGASLDEQTLDLDAAFAVGEADFPFYVTASGPEYFVIRPQSRRTRALIEWRLELDWSCLEQHGTATIDHGDRPFLSAP